VHRLAQQIELFTQRDRRVRPSGQRDGNHAELSGAIDRNRRHGQDDAREHAQVRDEPET
jgi:hypothetical protein